jgi:predicted metal-dependent hydrolase
VTLFEDGQTIKYRGEDCLISLEGEGRTARIHAGEPRILSVPGDPETTEARVVRFMKKQAKADLTKAVTRHCETLRVSFKGISVKDTRSRWGSCTADGQLAFSWRLIMAPASVRRSVIAHEVAHMRHMNHSPDFYAWLDVLFEGNRKAADQWLKMHGTGLQRVGR